MKINFIVPIYLPKNFAVLNRVKVFIDVLIKNGYVVNLITLSKNNNDIKKLFNLENINFYFIKYKDIQKDNFFKRAFQEFKYSLKLILLSKKIEADAVFMTSPSMFIILTGILERKSKIIDIRDIVWEYLSDNNLKNKAIKSILTFLIMKALKKYDKILVTNQYEEKYLNKFKPEIIYNGIEEKKFKVLSELKYSNSDNITITYAGNIGFAQNVITLIQAVENIKNIKVNIIGSGVKYKEIIDYVKKKNIDNINITGPKKWEEIIKFYEQTTFLWAQLSEEFSLAMPSKLYEYLSTGFPIIYGGEGQAKEFLSDFENCFVYKPNNVEELKNLLLKLQKISFKKSDKNIEKIKKQYIREKNAKKILKILKEVV